MHSERYSSAESTSTISRLDMLREDYAIVANTQALLVLLAKHDAHISGCRVYHDTYPRLCAPYM